VTVQHGRSVVRLTCLLLAAAAIAPAHAEGWLPVTQEELQMKSEPKAPAAPAIYLYRQVDRDDDGPHEFEYSRIKILTEEGLKYANVEIPFFKYSERIRNLEARTIRPDGSIVEFNGTVYEKPIVKSRGVKLLAKSFTMPNVEVGSIIEYRYRHDLPYGYVFNSRWILSADLFTRYAKFSLRPYRYYALTWSWPVGLPANTNPPKSEHGTIRLETHDVAAFVTEEYMPPEDVLKYRVEFIYSWDDMPEKKNPAAFWKAYGKLRYSSIEDFVGKRRVMEETVAQITQPGDSLEIKLRKIYARTQQLRNLSYERAKSEQETRRERQKDAHNVADVWKNGYGSGLDITWLFLALARAAGAEADPLLVATRDVYFFDPMFMNPWQLNTNAVVVKLDGKELFLDPGTAFTPFGLLPWPETAVRALRLDKQGGRWVSMPLPEPSTSRIERKLNLQLTTSGTLRGKATVTYTGLEALWRRIGERNEDETDRKQFLEDDIQGAIPSGSDATLTNAPAWNSSEPSLVAEYDLTVPGWAAFAGRRALLPVGLFGAGEKHMFEHAARVHALYFNFPYQHVDDITIELPAGWEVTSTPPPRGADLKLVAYDIATLTGKGTLHVKRNLTLNLTLVDSQYYDSLRGFFQNVRSGDEEQIVLSPSAAPARH
jgi:hypothetical protein